MISHDETYSYEDTVNTIKGQGIDDYTNLVDIATAGFERTESCFRKSSTVVKMLSNMYAGFGDIFHERSSHWECQVNCYCIFRNCHTHLTFSNQHLANQKPSTQRQGLSHGGDIAQ